MRKRDKKISSLLYYDIKLLYCTPNKAAVSGALDISVSTIFTFSPTSNANALLSVVERYSKKSQKTAKHPIRMFICAFYISVLNE